MVKEGDRVRLKTGEIAVISEVLRRDVAYIAEIFRRSGDNPITIDQIGHEEIAAVFVEQVLA